MSRRKHLQRSDRHGFRGWSVAITRRGKAHTRFFPDRVYGGRSGALRAAIRFRDDQLLALYPPLLVRSRSPRNKTGIIGVTFENHRVGGRLHPRFVACWPSPDGRTVRRRFSQARYGARRAFELAEAARAAGVEELERSARRALAERVLRRRS